MERSDVERCGGLGRPSRAVAGAVIGRPGATGCAVGGARSGAPGQVRSGYARVDTAFSARRTGEIGFLRLIFSIASEELSRRILYLVRISFY